MSQAVIGWLIAIVVFIVAEAATVTLVSVWFIGGAVCRSEEHTSELQSR